MADYKVPNLCGASESFNAAQSAFDDLINVAVDGLEIDPSTLKAQAESKLTALTGKLDTMLPELPELPDVNLQAELTSLTGLSPGSFQHAKMLTSLTSKFGSALSGGGFSLDTLVSEAADITSGKVPKGLIPDLPGLPDVDLQGELTKLSGLSSGSPAHTAMLSGLQSTVGDALAASGTSLDSLVSAAASAAAGLPGAGDMCSSIPNFTIPAAGGEAIQKAIGILQAAEESVDEDGATLNTNVNFTAAKTKIEEMFASYEKAGEGMLAANVGPFKIAAETTKVLISDGKGKVTTLDVTTALNAATSVIRSNVSEKGFSKRVVWKNGVKFFDTFDPNFAKLEPDTSSDGQLFDSKAFDQNGLSTDDDDNDYTHPALLGGIGGAYRSPGRQ